jgi:hypothetical protein
MPSPMPRLTMALAVAGALHAVSPLLGLPGAVAHAGEDTQFLWLAAAPDGNGGALLRYTDPPADFQVVAGTAAHTVPRAAWSRCYEGDVAPIIEAARAKGRIEHLELDRQPDIHELKVWFDDLGSPMESFRYRCGPDGMTPLSARGPGVINLVVFAALAAATALGVWRYRRRKRARAERAGRAD